MYKRSMYLDLILPFVGKPVVKVLVGMRRVGKSYLLRQIADELRNSSRHTAESVILVDMESLDFEGIKSAKDLTSHVKAVADTSAGPVAVLVDEVQLIDGWERAINSLLKTVRYDIYITGSNASMLSSDLATFLSGRFVEFPVYSLSYREFLMFRESEYTKDSFSEYLRFGGMPAIHHFDFDPEVVYQYLSGVYNSILLKDVVKRYEIRNVALLEKLTRFAFDNVGSLVSAKRIADYSKSQHLRVGVETVQNYLGYICATFAMHRVPRFDIKGKRLLEINDKYYLGDIGMRSALLGYRDADIAGLLENLVFLELCRRRYRVTVGKWDDLEIDFVAERNGARMYVQVAYVLESAQTIEREFSPLRKISDNYPKFVVSTDTLIGGDMEGIKRVNIADFLLDKDLY